MGAGLSQESEDGKIHPSPFLSRKLSTATLPYDIFDKKLLAIVYAFQKRMHYVLGTAHKTTTIADHQNLEYFTEKVYLNRIQARWAEILQVYDVVNIYRNGPLDQKADILSNCPAYTFREGNTTAILENPMLGPDRWFEIAAIQIYDDSLDHIDIAALDIALLSSDRKEAILQDATMDEEYIQLCNTVTKGENIDSSYTIQEHVLVGKGRICIPKAMGKKVLKSEHDLKVAEHFDRDRTMELVSRNVFWPKMEDNIPQYCN
jgi:hypothetical protein